MTCNISENPKNIFENEGVIDLPVTYVLMHDFIIEKGACTQKSKIFFRIMWFLMNQFTYKLQVQRDER